MKGRFTWWKDWKEKKDKYLKSTEKQLDSDIFHAICSGTGLPSIHQKSTFNFKNVEEGANRFLGVPHNNEKPFARVYTRLGNPNTEHLENVLFQLECKHLIDNKEAQQEENPIIGSLVFASGMAAISTTLMGFLQPGDGLVIGNVYGCTDSFARYLQDRWKIEVHFIDATDLNQVKKVFKENKNIAAMLIETPENPTLRIADIEEIAKITEEDEALLIVDNTFSSPYLQQPFRLGADIVIHSLTKYVNGHSSSIAGASLGPYEYFSTELFLAYKDFGATPSPFDSWLNSLCIQDMGIRIEAQTKTAFRLAEFLENHPKIEKIWYPGLESHPDHSVSKKQMRNGGGMIAFELKGGFDAGVNLMNYFGRPDTPMELAVSLGSVISYIEHPASMTHSVVPEEERCVRGITDSLVRLSVGTEGFTVLRDALNEGLEGA